MKVSVAATGIQNNPNDIHVFAAEPLFLENKSTNPTGAFNFIDHREWSEFQLNYKF